MYVCMAHIVSGEIVPVVPANKNSNRVLGVYHFSVLVAFQMLKPHHSSHPAAAAVLAWVAPRPRIKQPTRVPRGIEAAFKRHY